MENDTAPVYRKFIRKVLKGFAHASAGGGLAIGAGTMDLVNVDALTIFVMVIVVTLYNMAKEALKNGVRS